MSAASGSASNAIAALVWGVALLACSGGSGRARDAGPKDGGALEFGLGDDGGRLNGGADAGGDAGEDGGDMGLACNHDCECAGLLPPVTGGGWVCYQHRCRTSGVPPSNICAEMPDFVPPGSNYCTCRGGTCDERRCCVLPDGRIPYLTDPECQSYLDAGASDGG